MKYFIYILIIIGVIAIAYYWYKSSTEKAKLAAQTAQFEAIQQANAQQTAALENQGFFHDVGGFLNQTLTGLGTGLGQAGGTSTVATILHFI